MDIFCAMTQRRSIRRFHPEPIPDVLLNRVLEAAQWAPSAGNRQAFEIVLVRDRVRRTALARASLEQWFIAEAPVVLVFVAAPRHNRSRYGRRGAELYAVQDATIACAHAHLAAAALGLGSCWIGAFDEEAVAKLIGAEHDERPVAILPIGRPAEDPPPTSRRALEDL
ncbi:MAG TPA: nitroreductase family protein, partial [Bryobacteraceae bacterium]|nr:nitroreductase family protein [Bryobacteraceae bacterium]